MEEETPMPEPVEPEKPAEDEEPEVEPEVEPEEPEEELEPEEPPRHRWTWLLPEDERVFAIFGNIEWVRGLSGWMIISDMPIAVAYTMTRYGDEKRWSKGKEAFLWFLESPWWKSAMSTTSALNFGTQLYCMITGFGHKKVTNYDCIPEARWYTNAVTEQY